MDGLAALEEDLTRADSYAGLRFATDTGDQSRGALVAKVEERATAIRTQLLFFELEWAALDDERAEALLADPRLDAVRHHLRVARLRRPHLLTEPEERIAAEKDLTAIAAWQRLFEEQDAAIEVTLDGERRGLEHGLSLLAHPDRSVRQAAAEAVTEGLAPGLRTRAFILNTILLEKATDDRLRHYDHWLASRNLVNQASDASVAALIDAVKSRYDLPQRWYRIKAGLLGLDRLADYDRSCSVASEDRPLGWSDATELVLDAYDSFSPELAGICRRFLDEGWIDAPATPGKRSGAFCAYTVPSHHPYVMLNWTGRRSDALTLAHELGHGVHGYLARPRGIFQMSTPLTMAETASVFGETVTFGRLLADATDPADRLSLLSERIDGAIATVFRQVAMNQFEDRIHTTRRTDGELSVERFGELWAETQAEMFGDAMEVTDGLPQLVELHLALLRRPGVRVRLRLRPAAGPVGLPSLRGGRRGLRPARPGDARRRRLAAPGGAGPAGRLRPRGPRLLARRSRHHRGPDRRRRGRRGRPPGGLKLRAPRRWRRRRPPRPWRSGGSRPGRGGRPGPR